MPLDHDHPHGENIEVLPERLSLQTEQATLPYLVYIQGGPGLNHLGRLEKPGGSDGLSMSSAYSLSTREGLGGAPRSVPGVWLYSLRPRRKRNTWRTFGPMPSFRTWKSSVRSWSDQ